LFADNGWNGFFIECDEKRYKSLLSNYKDNKNISCIRKFINSNYNLNDLVEEYKINNLDILSINIDGKDLTELNKLKSIKPIIIVIEFNMTIPFDVEHEDLEGSNSSSYLSIKNYLENKQYELIFVTTGNLIFIDKNFNNKEFEAWNTKKIIDKFNPVRFGFNNFGEMFFIKNKKIIKSELFRFPTMKSFITFQPVPKFIRKLTDENGKGYKIIKILYSHIILFLLRPNLFIKKIFSKIKQLFKI